MRLSCEFGLGADRRTEEAGSGQSFWIFQARMRDRVESGVRISQENLGTQSSRSRYRLDSRRSTESELWSASKLIEFRASKNTEEEANRSGQDVSRDHKESRKTRPCRVS